MEAEACDEYADFYAADPIVDQYTEFHYGKRAVAQGEASFPLAIAKYVNAKATQHGMALTLAADIGCRSGRSSFELSTLFQQVQGIDFSARYIMPGCQMRECAQTKWDVPTIGELKTPAQASATDFDLEELVHKTSFWQSDPCNLHAHLTGYTTVLVNLNMMERLINPKHFLEHIHERMTEKSMLVIATTHDWNEVDCPREQWLSGFLENGKPVSGIEGLHRCLDAKWSFQGAESLPYKLPLTELKSIDGIAEVTTWLRN